MDLFASARHEIARNPAKYRQVPLGVSVQILTIARDTRSQVLRLKGVTEAMKREPAGEDFL